MPPLLLSVLGVLCGKIRQLQKIPLLYWADKLGYLVWGEYPDWGIDYTHPEALKVVLKDECC